IAFGGHCSGGPTHQVRHPLLECFQFALVTGGGFEDIAEFQLSESSAAQVTEGNLTRQNQVCRNAWSNDGVSHKRLYRIIAAESRFANRLLNRCMRALHASGRSREIQTQRAHEVRGNCQSFADAVKVVEWEEQANAGLSGTSMRHFDLAKIIVAQKEAAAHG